MAGDNNFKAQRKFINSFQGDPKSSVRQTNYLKEATRDEKTKLTQELSPSHFLSQSDVKRSKSNSEQKNKERS